MTAARSVEGGTDQFFTRPDLAARLVSGLVHNGLLRKKTVAVEPSAGAGAFMGPLQKACDRVIGIDIEPQHHSVVRCDFFEFTDWPAAYGGGGSCRRQSAVRIRLELAIRFFNHAAAQDCVGVIAFVLPRTFRKESVHAKLSRSFALLSDEPLPKDSFLLDGRPYDVPCCWHGINDSAQRRSTL